MVNETTYLVGDPEPFDETLRKYFSDNWDDSKTNSITPVFLSAYGKDGSAADYDTETSEADVNVTKASGLILFESTEDIPEKKPHVHHRTIETTVEITIYGPSKYEIGLFIEHFNDIIADNQPSGNFRIQKTDGAQDSAIAYFKQHEGVKFSKPRLQDKKGHVFISTGSLSCMWIKTKTS